MKKSPARQPPPEIVEKIVEVEKLVEVPVPPALTQPLCCRPGTPIAKVKKFGPDFGDSFSAESMPNLQPKAHFAASFNLDKIIGK